MTPAGAADGAMIEQDLDRLVHASPGSAELRVPGMAESEIAEILEITDGLARLREVERELSEAARSALQVSAQEMSALQFIVVARRRGDIVSPSMLAEHMHISAASTTKLLNKLERAGHVSRLLHPHDRRGIKLEVDPKTEALVQRSVGRQQARRFAATARLKPEERRIVAGFLDELIRGINGDKDVWNGVRRESQAEPPVTD